jgi:sulfur transfer protein SufE
MGKPQFPFPESALEAMRLLNGSESQLWNLCITERDDALYVYDGDQVMFVARTEEEIQGFLSGAFLATFNGKSLDEIRSQVVHHSIETDD